MKLSQNNSRQQVVSLSQRFEKQEHTFVQIRLAQLKETFIF